MNKNNFASHQESDLTIILSQFGREKFSDRFLGYISKNSTKYPIIYSDGDANGIGRRISEKYQAELKLQYIEYKQEIKFNDFYSMMVNSLSNVKTKYVMLCDNDDFIIESGVQKLISFLDENEEYVSAGSPTLLVQIDGSSEDVFGKNIYFDSINPFYREYETLNESDNQIKESFLRFQPNYYYIFRSEVLLNIWKDILKIDFSDLTIMEFFFQLKTLTYGNQYTLKNNLHYVRQTGTGTFAKGYDFSDNLVRNNLPNDVRSLAKNISLHYDSTQTTADDIYESILSNYALSLNHYLPHNVMRYRFQRLFKIKIFLKIALSKLTFFENIYFMLKEKRLMLKLKKLYGKEVYKKTAIELQKIKNYLKSK